MEVGKVEGISQKYNESKQQDIKTGADNKKLV
jgi:hypothetical protein